MTSLMPARFTEDACVDERRTHVANPDDHEDCHVYGTISDSYEANDCEQDPREEPKGCDDGDDTGLGDTTGVVKGPENRHVSLAADES